MRAVRTRQRWQGLGGPTRPARRPTATSPASRAERAPTLPARSRRHAGHRVRDGDAVHEETVSPHVPHELCGAVAVSDHVASTTDRTTLEQPIQESLLRPVLHAIRMLAQRAYCAHVRAAAHAHAARTRTQRFSGARYLRIRTRCRRSNRAPPVMGSHYVPFSTFYLAHNQTPFDPAPALDEVRVRQAPASVVSPRAPSTCSCRRKRVWCGVSGWAQSVWCPSSSR